MPHYQQQQEAATAAAAMLMRRQEIEVAEFLAKQSHQRTFEETASSLDAISRTRAHSFAGVHPYRSHESNAFGSQMLPKFSIGSQLQQQHMLNDVIVGDVGEDGSSLGVATLAQRLKELHQLQLIANQLQQQLASTQMPATSANQLAVSPSEQQLLDVTQLLLQQQQQQQRHQEQQQQQRRQLEEGLLQLLAVAAAAPPHPQRPQPLTNSSTSGVNPTTMTSSTRVIGNNLSSENQLRRLLGNLESVRHQEQKQQTKASSLSPPNPSSNHLFTTNATPLNRSTTMSTSGPTTLIGINRPSTSSHLLAAETGRHLNGVRRATISSSTSVSNRVSTSQEVALTAGMSDANALAKAATTSSGSDDDEIIFTDPRQIQIQKRQVEKFREKQRQQRRNTNVTGGADDDSSASLRYPYSNESAHAIVRFLMKYNLSTDVEFSKKAIESLIKRLKEKRNELDIFIQSVVDDGLNEASTSTCTCVTIPRTLDGRLQVAGRKGFPHIVYARIFRWPELHKNEAKHLPMCTAPFDAKCDSVCINPFHYTRITQQTISVASVIIPQQRQHSATTATLVENHLYSGGAIIKASPPKYHQHASINSLNHSPLKLALAKVVAPSNDVAITQITDNKPQQHQPTPLSPEIAAVGKGILSATLSETKHIDEAAAEASLSPHAESKMNVDAIKSDTLIKPTAQTPESYPSTAIRSPKSERKHTFLERMRQLDGNALIAHFSAILRAELRNNCGAAIGESDENSSPSCTSASAFVKMRPSADGNNGLTDMLRRFPLTISVLLRLLNEVVVNSTSSTPQKSRSRSSLCGNSGGAHDGDDEEIATMSSMNGVVKATTPPGQKREWRVDDESVADLSPSAKRQCHHNDDHKALAKDEEEKNAHNSSPSLEKQHSRLIRPTAAGVKEEEEALEKHSATNFVEILHELLAELAALQKETTLSGEQKAHLVPLVNTLEACVANGGAQKALALVIEAIFENIGMNKALPSLAGGDKTVVEPSVHTLLTNCEGPVYEIAYNEFNERIGTPAQFYTSLVYCGATLPPPASSSEEAKATKMMMMEIATNKVSGRLNAIQTQALYDCRKHIADGLALEITAEGDVYLRCLSRRPIYVESAYLDREAMRVPGDAMHVIYQQAAIKVFDLWQSFQLMCFWITQRKVLSRRNPSLHSSQKLMSDLNSLCRFRVSFGGINSAVNRRLRPYTKLEKSTRLQIQDTPCWLEITLAKAQRLLDRLLSRPEMAYDFVFNNQKNNKLMLASL